MCQCDVSKLILKTLTTICSLYKVGFKMVKRLTVFIFIFVVGISVLTGTPLHAQKSDTMKCCKSALQSVDSARLSAADLCCVVNCSQSGVTTKLTTSVQMTRFVSLIPNLFRFNFQERTASPKLVKRLFYSAKLFSPNTTRLYLRYSAFLI